MRNCSSSHLKSQARTVLAGVWGFASFACILEFLCNTILQGLVDFAFPFYSADGINILQVICQLIIGVFSAILSAGSACLYLNICQDRPSRLTDLFYGFRNQPERLLTWFLMIIGIAVLFSLAPATLLVLYLLIGSRTLLTALFAVTILCFAGMIRVITGYAMFPYLYVESPWKSTRELMKESHVMMQGHKWRYFYLQLSFIGVILLSVLTFGIGFLWVQPYMSAVNAYFYLSLKQRSQGSC